MEISIAIIMCIVLLIVFRKLFPMKMILKLVLNSFCGAILIYFINVIGTSFGFHIGLNAVSSVIVGVLGIPGAIFLILFKIFCV